MVKKRNLIQTHMPTRKQLGRGSPGPCDEHHAPPPQRQSEAPQQRRQSAPAPPLYSEAPRPTEATHGGGADGGACSSVVVGGVASVLCCEGRSSVFYRVPCSAISHLPTCAAPGVTAAVTAAHRASAPRLWSSRNQDDHEKDAAAVCAREEVQTDTQASPPLVAGTDNRRGGAWLICWDHTRGHCRKGSRCRFAHVDVPVAALAPLTYHQRFVWRDVRYVVGERLSSAGERALGLPAGALEAAPLLVLGINKKGARATIPAGQLLRTRGALESLTYVLRKGSSSGQGGVGVTSRCAHYHLSGLCERGPDCAFAHVLHFQTPPRLTAQHAASPPAEAPAKIIKGRGADSDTVGDSHTRLRAPSRPAPFVTTTHTPASSPSNGSLGGLALSRSEWSSLCVFGDGAPGGSSEAEAGHWARSGQNGGDPRIAELDAMLADLGVSTPFSDCVHALPSSSSPTPLVEASLAAVGLAAAVVLTVDDLAASPPVVVRRPHPCPYGLSPHFPTPPVSLPTM